MLAYSLTICRLEDFGHVESDLEIAEDVPIAEKQTLPYLSEGMSQNLLHEKEEEDERDAHLSKFNAELELQVWKKEEEQKFRQLLVDKETELIEKLSKEWQARDRDREKILKKNLADFRTLENQVQNLLVDLEQRERNVTSNEGLLVKKREELERDSRRRVDEMRENSRRLNEDSKRDVEREKSKSTEMEALNRAAQSERKETEGKYKQLEADFLKLRLSLNESPEKALQVQVAKLERDLDASEQAKKNYKGMYAKATKELSLIKRDRKMESEERVLKDRRELESMKLQQFAKDDMIRSKSDDDKVLMEIKQELNDLKHKSYGEDKKKKQGSSENLDPKARGEIDRLLQEKKSLLDSGLYSASDLVLGEIDARVEELRLMIVA
jgi:centrosomal protein CEP120